MDPDVMIMHSVSLNDLKSQDLILVRIASDFNRLQPSQTDSFSEDLVDAIWQKRTLENPKLYNGTKFRVHSIVNSNISEGMVEMKIGVTDYKTYLGTNWANNVKDLQQLGIDCHGNPQTFLSDPLGVGSFLISVDKYIILLKRNFHCAEAPNLWDTPGGHAEPKNVVGDVPLDKIDLSKTSGDAVCKEIFSSIVQEIIDEVNIPHSNLAEPLYMGTARNMTSGGRPSLEFLVRCSLTRDEIYSNYHKGSQLEADESTNIKFVPVDEIKHLQQNNQDLWNCLAPSAKGCMILYQMAHGICWE